ncbi:hypothetical protein JW758_01060 [Candidatus Peregrinibacteria bacterium]|nr:hypothetical protein [Candidatus Peregrinibacteria bacterium]
MKKGIQSIINDLYKIDPSLKKQGKDLEKLVEKLIEAKPDIKMDKVFVNGLRRSLSAKAEEMSNKPAFKFSLLNFLYTFGSVAIALVIIISLYDTDQLGRKKIEIQNTDFNINELIDEQEMDIDINLAPIIRTQKMLPVVDKVVDQVVEPIIESPEDDNTNIMMMKELDDVGEGAEESIIRGGGSSATFFDEPTSDAIPPKSDGDIPEIDEYYLDLMDVCKTRSKPDCCFASVEVMISGGYKLMTADGCPDGFKIGMLDCGSDIRWCE